MAVSFSNRKKFATAPGASVPKSASSPSDFAGVTVAEINAFQKGIPQNAARFCTPCNKFSVLPASAPEGVLADLLARDAAAKRTFVTHTPGPDARPARLSYRVLGVRDGRTLVRIRLETGRTHQIRAQFSSRGLPLCGDRKYGAKADGPLGLWSYQIAFFHPQTNEHLVFTHDPPQTEPWLAFFDTLKEK